MNGDHTTPNITPVYTGTPPHTYFFAMPCGTTQDVASCVDSTDYTVVPQNFIFSQIVFLPSHAVHPMPPSWMFTILSLFFFSCSLFPSSSIVFLCILSLSSCYMFLTPASFPIFFPFPLSWLLPSHSLLPFPLAHL